MIDSTAPPPTFLIAQSPKRIASPSGVKSMSDLLTSGGRTRMPMSRHSLMYFTTLAVLPVSDVSSADMNSIGVVRLQVRGDVGQIGVSGRVRLVEAVAGELLHQVEDLLDLLLRVVPFQRALDEAVALLRHLLGLLLAHGAAQQVGFAQRVAASLLAICITCS